MRGIIYARQSKKEEEENSYSIPSQIDEMTEYAQQHKIEFPHEPIIDRGISGQSIHRDGIEKVLKLIKQDDQLDCFLVVDVDRIGRFGIEPLFFMWILNNQGIKIISKDREYDMINNPTDIVLSSVDCYRSFMEGRKIGERTQRAKIARFKDGIWIQSHIPEGYDKKVEFFDNGKSKKVWIYKLAEKEPVIQELFTLFKNEPTYKDVISSMKVKFKQTFNKDLKVNILKRILQDPVYIGNPLYGRTTRCEPELAMIDETLFNEVQEKICKFSDSHKPKRQKRDIIKELTKEYGLGFALRTVPELVLHCICGGHMKSHDGSITKGVYVTRFKCDTCNKQKTIPTGKQIDSYKNLNLLSCPYCRETEFFEYSKTIYGDEYTYKCLKCNGSFKSSVNPNRYLRKIEAKKEKAAATENVTQTSPVKKQDIQLALNIST
jgi:DNA invertase Pin-like site-specific DNA recombinase/transposase-like protein